MRSSNKKHGQIFVLIFPKYKTIMYFAKDVFEINKKHSLRFKKKHKFKIKCSSKILHEF